MVDKERFFTKLQRQILSRQPDAIEVLKSENHTVKTLFDEFAKNSIGYDKASLLRSIVRALSAHVMIAEKLVFPKAQPIGESTAESKLEGSQGRFCKLIAEHQVIDLAVAELRDVNPTDDVTRAKVAVLAELVMHHVRDEERHVLSHLSLSPDDQATLIAAIGDLKKKQRTSAA